MDLELRGKVAMITGGSRGIGKQVARELAREGVDVALVARDPEQLKATAAEISEEFGVRAMGYSANTADDESVRQTVQQIVTDLGRVDILVNAAAQAAGQGPAPKLAGITETEFDAEMHVKVMGYIRCAREVAPYMIKNGWGRIVNISGLAARNAASILGSARNIAVVAVTKNLAEELGPQGINVTVVHPGTTVTEKLPETLAYRAKQWGVSVKEAEKRMGAGTSIRRLVTAQEIAYVVTFLASPKSVGINGDVIAAGGGTGGIYP